MKRKWTGLLLALVMLFVAGQTALTAHAQEIEGGGSYDFTDYKGYSYDDAVYDEYGMINPPYWEGIDITYYLEGKKDPTPKPSVTFDAESLPDLYKGQTLAFLLNVTRGGYDYEWVYVQAQNTDINDYVTWWLCTRDIYGLDGKVLDGEPGSIHYVLPNGDSDGSFGYLFSPGHYRIYACVYGKNTDVQNGERIIVGNADYVSEYWTTMDFNLVPETRPETIQMFRLYNDSNREHFYTADAYERSVLISRGWHNEGVGWYAPNHSHTPVYRLLNPFTSDHHYTMDLNEVSHLITVGWKFEGVGWYSDDLKRVPLFRQFSPVLETGTHNYTTSAYERDVICDGISWIDEGIAWYAVAEGHPLD